jgi:hypothetical protein
VIQRNAGFGARRGAARSTSTPWVRPTTWETHSRPRRLRGASGERLRGAPPRVTTRASREPGSGWRRAAGELNKRAEPSARARAPRPRAEPLLPPRRPAELLPGEARPAGARTARARRRGPTGAGAPPSRGYARRCSRPSVALARPRSGRPTPPPQGAGCGGAHKADYSSLSQREATAVLDVLQVPYRTARLGILAYPPHRAMYLPCNIPP